MGFPVEMSDEESGPESEDASFTIIRRFGDAITHIEKESPSSAREYSGAKLLAEEFMASYGIGSASSNGKRKRDQCQELANHFDEGCNSHGNDGKELVVRTKRAHGKRRKMSPGREEEREGMVMMRMER